MNEFLSYLYQRHTEKPKSIAPEVLLKQTPSNSSPHNEPWKWGDEIDKNSPPEESKQSETYKSVSELIASHPEIVISIPHQEE